MSRRPVLQLRDGMLLTYGIALRVASIQQARIVRLWFDGGPARLLELRLSEKPNLSWHAHLMDRFSPWRSRFFRNLADYTPPPDPYLVLSLPETDLSDEEIVNALNLARPA